jgi:hypothetical protein
MVRTPRASATVVNDRDRNMTEDSFAKPPRPMCPGQVGHRRLGTSTLHIPHGTHTKSAWDHYSQQTRKMPTSPRGRQSRYCAVARPGRSLRCRNYSRPSTGKESSHCCTTGPDHDCALITVVARAGRAAPSQLPHQRRSSSGALDGAGLFAVLAGLSALAALLVLIAVPDQTPEQPRQSNAPAASLWAAYRDRRFWRIAPLSAVGVGTSWSLQGLWAAPWLRDVEGLERATVVQHLSGMAIAVCIAALFFGTVANRLRRMGVTTELTLAMTVVMSMTAQAALVTGCSIPSLVLWTVIAATPVTDRG